MRDPKLETPAESTAAPTVQDLRRRLGILHDQMKALAKKADDQSRKMTADENEEWDRMHRDYNDIRAKIALIEVGPPHASRLNPELVKARVREYVQRENPRRLPEGWIHGYLERDPTLLALDVMRGYDKSVRVEKALGWEKIWRRILTAALVGSWAFFGWACKFAFEHLTTLESLLRK